MSRALSASRAKTRTALKFLIKDLEDEGAIARGRKSLARRGACRRWWSPTLSSATATAIWSPSPSTGAKPAIRQESSCGATKSKRERGAAPGMGARVLMRVEFDPVAGRATPPIAGGSSKSSTRRARARLPSIASSTTAPGARCRSTSAAPAREIFIPFGMHASAGEGDLVALELLREGRFGLPSARVVERLGAINTERAVEPDRARRTRHPLCLLPRSAQRSRSGAAGDASIGAKTGAPAVRHHRPARRQGP